MPLNFGRNLMLGVLLIAGLISHTFAYSLNSGRSLSEGIPNSNIRDVVSMGGFSELDFFAVQGNPSLSKEPDFWEIKGKVGKFEFGMGNGFMARGTSVIRNDFSYKKGSSWLDLKFRPYSGERQYEAFNFHFGLHHTSGIAKDPTRPNACLENTFNAKFSETCSYEGPKYYAFYSGAQVEFVEVVAREPRPTRVYLGAGVGHIAPAVPNGTLFPYTSAEISYRLSRQIETKGGVMLSAFPGVDQVGVAATSLSFEYHF
ncbi:MAG: hypothetical protein AABZ55_16065 [Bdellovibrionota bacterium]